MSFNYINKSIILIILIFIISCQSDIKKTKNNIIKNIEIENNDSIDLSYNNIEDFSSIDFYTENSVKFNFDDKKLSYYKINSNENKFDNNLSLNIIYLDTQIYSINKKGEILIFNTNDGSLINRIKPDLPSLDNTYPISFSFYNENFIVGYKSGHIVRLDKLGKVKWIFNKNKILNTPLKINGNKLIILFSDEVVFLSLEEGKPIFEKKYLADKVIQSSGGKFVQYSNLIYFILPNSSFHSIDTLLLEEHRSNIDNLELKTSLNNLKDKIHIYKNLFVYLDNEIIINTFDIINDDLILQYSINNLNSSYIFNNFVIAKNSKTIDFHNIKNGNVFFQINIEKVFKQNSQIIKVMVINNKLHIFSDNGKLIIINSSNTIEKIIDLKIRNINRIYNYKNKIFITTNKGFTYIF